MKKGKNKDEKKETTMKYKIAEVSLILIGATIAISSIYALYNSIPMPISDTKGILFFPQGKNKIDFDPENYIIDKNKVIVDINPKKFNDILVRIAKANKSTLFSIRGEKEKESVREIQHLFFAFNDQAYAFFDIKRFLKSLPPNVFLYGIYKTNEDTHLTPNNIETKMQTESIQLFPRVVSKSNLNISEMSIRDQKIAKYGEIYSYFFKKFNSQQTIRDKLRDWNPFVQKHDWSPNSSK